MQYTLAATGPLHGTAMILSKLLSIIHERPNVSDIHISADEPLYMRSPGGYDAFDDEPVAQDELEEFIASNAIGGQNWRTELMAQKGKLDGAVDLTSSRVRYSIYETDGISHHINIVMRIIRNLIIPLESLGSNQNVLKELVLRGKGLIIITGPTGSGKTTTLSSIIDRINAERSCHIMTIEDPIEHVHRKKKALISQREIGTNVDSFASGLEGAMRQRPDVIAVGELLDRETVETLFRAADSGHMVLATTHGRSAKDVINRLLGFFSTDERVQRRQVLASCLTCITSQVLVPSVSRDEWVLASELLVNTAGVRSIIASGNLAQLPAAMQQGRAEGMNLLSADLARLVRENRINPQQARMAAYDESM